jgi:hypothetical protein
MRSCGRRGPRAIGYAVTAACLAAATHAFATLTWDTGSASYFSAHWNGQPPAIGDSLLIQAGGSPYYNCPANTNIILNYNASDPSTSSPDGSTLEIASGGSLNINQAGATGSGYGLLVDTGGQLTVDAGANLNVAGGICSGEDAGNSAQITLNGTVNIGPGTSAGLIAGNSGSGLISQQSPASVVISPAVDIGLNMGSSGAYNLSGGSVTTGTFWVGCGNQSNGACTINGSNASVTAASVCVGLYAGSIGNLTINSGTFNSSGGAFVGGSNAGAGGDGTLTLNGPGGLSTAGTLTVYSGGTVYVTGGSLSVAGVNQLGGLFYDSGTLTLAGSGANASLYDLGGGTLLANAMTVSGGGLFNWTGGALSLINGSVTVGPGGVLGANLNVSSGKFLKILGSGQSLAISNGGSVSTPGLSISIDSNGTGSYVGGTLEASAVVQSGGSFISTGALYVGSEFFVGASVASYTLSGGSLTTGSLLIDNESFILDGGSLSLANNGLAVNGVSEPIAFVNGGTLNWSAGTVTFASGGLTVGTGGALGTSLTLNSGQTLNLTGLHNSLQLTGNLNINGGGFSVPAIVQTSGSLTDTCTLVLAGTGGNAVSCNLAGGSLAAAELSIKSGGVLNLLASSNSGVIVRTLGGITLSGTGSAAGQMSVFPAMSRANRQLVVAAALAFAGSPGFWQGQLDLADNDLDLQAGSLATITSQVDEGYNGGHWNGAGGVASTSAAADTSHLSALGVIENNQNGASVFNASNPFDGTVPGAGDVLIKYTMYGDANLDGRVNGADYTLIDNGFLNRLSGWYNGDFNYDGVVNGSDYTLIDNAFNTQGVQADALSADSTAEIQRSATVSGVLPVPEPGAVAFLAGGFSWVLMRRGRSSADRR